MCIITLSTQYNVEVQLQHLDDVSSRYRQQNEQTLCCHPEATPIDSTVAEHEVV